MMFVSTQITLQHRHYNRPARFHWSISLALTGRRNKDLARRTDSSSFFASNRLVAPVALFRVAITSLFRLRRCSSGRFFNFRCKSSGMFFRVTVGIGYNHNGSISVVSSPGRFAMHCAQCASLAKVHQLFRPLAVAFAKANRRRCHRGSRKQQLGNAGLNFPNALATTC